MRLTFLSCLLPLALVSMMASGQQTKPSASQQGAQQSPRKDSGAPSSHPKAEQTAKTPHRILRKQHSRASYRHGAKHATYRPEYTQNAVEVINGTSTQKIIFHSDEMETGSSESANAPMKVEVVNGTSTDTQYFAQGRELAGAAESKRPVVVGIQSSDTKFVGGNKHPVVTGITSVGTGSAKSAAGGGDAVTKTVSPRPKRPAYQSDSH